MPVDSGLPSHLLPLQFGLKPHSCFVCFFILCSICIVKISYSSTKYSVSLFCLYLLSYVCNCQPASLKAMLCCQNPVLESTYCYFTAFSFAVLFNLAVEAFTLYVHVNI